MLKHVAEKHDNSNDERIKESEVKGSKESKDTEKDNCPIEKGKFTCSNCKKIVPNEDSLYIHKEDSQKMCQLCTMITQYG